MKDQNINLILQTKLLKLQINTFFQMLNMTKLSDQAVQIDPNVEIDKDDKKNHQFDQ